MTHRRRRTGRFGLPANVQERDHVSTLLSKANAAGAAPRALTTADTVRAMDRVQQSGARYQPMETRR